MFGPAVFTVLVTGAVNGPRLGPLTAPATNPVITTQWRPGSHCYSLSMDRADEFIRQSKPNLKAYRAPGQYIHKIPQWRSPFSAYCASVKYLASFTEL